MERLYVIACQTVTEELRPHLPEGTTVCELEFGLHRNPDKLREMLQAEIDGAPDGHTVLLGYGLCGGGADGLRAGRNRLVIPRVHDCIALFLGSREAHEAELKREVGTYYVTKGWLEVDDLLAEYERLVKKYGPERGPEIARLPLENYTRLALVKTGNYAIDHYRELARRSAEAYKLRYEELQGSPDLVRALATGVWDERFLVFEPGECVKMSQFM